MDVANQLLNEAICRCILRYYPDTQAIYLFGSWGTPWQTAASDVDIAVLLPPLPAKQVDPWQWLELAQHLAAIVGTARADVINLRQVNTVLQKEIVMAERRIYCADLDSVLAFEGVMLSYYQQLQMERRAIIEDALRTGRFRHV